MRRLPGLLIIGLTAVTAGATLAQDAASPGLPLRDVVLFSSGVGYFQRQGTVNGSTTVDLGFRAEAALSRSLGFLGKSCIHPRQVEWANDVFRASEAEIAHARKVVDAAQAAHAQGRGAFVVDGRMVDAPYLKRAEATLRAARP